MKFRKHSHGLLITVLAACMVTGGWLTRTHFSAQTTAQALQRLTAENQVREREIENLRQALAHTSAHEASAIEKSLQDRRALVAQLKQARLTAPPPPPSPPRRPPNPSGPGGDHFPELMSDPEYARLATRLLRSNARSLWLHAFRYAGIPVEKQDQLRALLLEFGLSGDDATHTARLAGATEEQSWQARMLAHRDISAEITALIGAEAYVKVKRAQRGNDISNFVERLEVRLSYSGTPLQAAQGTQLFQLSIEMDLDQIIATSTTFPALFEKARAFLTADQLQALSELAAYDIQKSF